MNEENSNWYVAYTSGLGSRAATQIQSLLERMGYKALLWIPVQKQQITKYGRVQNTDHPLFPSYIFISTKTITDSLLEQALMEAKIGRLLHYPGMDQQPAIISEEDIQHLRSLEEADIEPVPEEITVIDVGNLVEVCVGPFMGIKGIVTQVKNHMAIIETIVFGRSAPVSININHLSKMSEDNPNEKENSEN